MLHASLPPVSRELSLDHLPSAIPKYPTKLPPLAAPLASTSVQLRVGSIFNDPIIATVLDRLLLHWGMARSN